MQGRLHKHYGRVRATEDAPRGPFRLLECRHGLAEIVERDAVGHAERIRVSTPQLDCGFITVSQDALRHGDRFAQQSVNAPSNPAGWWPGWSPTPLDIACRWPHWGRRNREIWALLLRAGATIKPAESLPGGTIYPPYMRKIIDAGGFKAYEKASCKSFMALLAPKLPHHLPPEVVEIIVMFSFHVGFY